MDLFLFVLKYTVTAIIDVLLIAMFVRAITSWFDPMREGKLSMFLLMLTEPVIFPIRALCDRMNWFEGMPIDIPFLLTVLVLSILQTAVAFL
ncbi:MAG: YggT family protein [Clostridia bacterium]|nr:YggT family protein [Clostridia bacterium]